MTAWITKMPWWRVLVFPVLLFSSLHFTSLFPSFSLSCPLSLLVIVISWNCSATCSDVGLLACDLQCNTLDTFYLWAVSLGQCVLLYCNLIVSVFMYVCHCMSVLWQGVCVLGLQKWVCNCAWLIVKCVCACMVFWTYCTFRYCDFVPLKVLFLTFDCLEKMLWRQCKHKMTC